MRGRGLTAAIVAAMLVVPSAAGAQEANQVTGLTASQDYGFTTLKWNPVAGATDYQIERTPVDASGTATGASAVVGVWQPRRTITPVKPAFAESGYALGGRYTWRVRARLGTTTQPYSAPVTGTTQGHWGEGPGASLRTAYEQNTDGPYTTDVQEAEYTAALDAASDRLRVVELARTLENRPQNLFVIGYPKPPETAAEISALPTYALNCNVHGNEASGRESCFTIARQLAFTQDPQILEMLSRMVVLIVPTTNPDGRAHNTRGNTTGQDLNRDHAALEQAETKGIAKLIRDYTPDVMVDNHEGDSEDLPILGARHLNVEQGLFDEGKLMVNEWMYGAASQSGWWMGPYSTGGDSHEGILRNTGALKNGVSMLGEARAAGGVTRPAEGSTNSAANRRRKVYAHLWENWEGMRYFYRRMPQIQAAIARSIAYQTGNTVASTVLTGAYPWPLVPSVGDDPSDQPDVDALQPQNLLDPTPCGYFIPQAEYTMARVGPENDFGSVQERLALHGIVVEPQPGGVLVRLRQPYRGLIAPILDAAAPRPMLTTAQRRYACPQVEAPVGATVPPTLTLSLGTQPAFGAFTPGVARDYFASSVATVTSSAGDAALIVQDTSPVFTNRLTNGAFALAQELQARNSAGAFQTMPAGLRFWSGPTASEAVPVELKQSVGANEPLRSGTYSKTLTFTLSTTTP
jgi:predicted deacylase